LLFSNAVLSAHTYHRHGMLQAVDATAKTLTIVKERSGGRYVFTWNDGTEFLKGDAKAGPEAFPTGTGVVVYYNRSLFPSLKAVRVTLDAGMRH
jgi:hypothetical protein